MNNKCLFMKIMRVLTANAVFDIIMMLYIALVYFCRIQVDSATSLTI